MSKEKIQNLFDEIFDSINTLLERTKEVNTTDDFLSSDYGLEKLDAVSMRLQVIGETLKKVEKENPEFLENYKEMDWNKIIKMREIISHHYFDLDAEIIFDVVKTHLPDLKVVVSKIISDLNKEN